MSLEHFNSMSETDESDDAEEVTSSDSSPKWDCNWHIKPEGYWDDVDERFFGEDTPNSPPLMAVPERLAAEIHILDDPELVEEVAEFWFPEEPDKYVEVAKIIFNDLATWHLPLPPWDRDPARFRDHIVKEYVPQVIKWEAVLNGEDPETAVEEWDKPWVEEDPEWFDRVGDTGLSEENRKWFNEEKDWVTYIDREVKSTGDEVNLDVEDDEDWADDW